MFPRNSKRIVMVSIASFIFTCSCMAQQAAVKPVIKVPAKVVAPVRKGAMTDFSAKLPKLNTVSVSMICATSDSASKSVVLKWVVDNDWLPEQGFNLYRKGPGDAGFMKIAGPIRENPNAAPVVLSTINGVNKTINIADLQKQAKLATRIPDNMMQAFKPAPTNVQNSRPIFDELKQLRVKEFTPVITATRADFGIVKPDAYSKLNNYFQRFKVQRTLPFITESASAQSHTVKSFAVPAQVLRTGNTQKMAPTVKSPVQMTVEARRALLMGALVNKSVCDALGLGYVDISVKDGQTYEYQLRKITGDAPVAACSITVGTDPLPIKPDEFSACQLDLNNIALRWKLDDSKTSARVISYNIYRIQDGKRRLANKQPLMVGMVEDGKGNYADLIYYFTDKGVPVGEVQYELIGVDAFDRQTTPAKLSYTMQDWETPQPVNALTTAVHNGQVYLYWQPSMRSAAVKTGDGSTMKAMISPAGGAAMYNLYRYDQEGNKVWTKLNSEPIKPSYIPPPAFSKQYASKIKSMSKSSNLSFIDKTCRKDAYYQYTVVAVYKKNMIESPPSPSQTVGVPDLDQPAAVTGLVGKHEALVSQTPQFSFDARWERSSSAPTKVATKVKNLSFDPTMKKTASKAPVSVGGSVAKNAAGNRVVDRSKTSRTADVIKATIANSDLGGKVKLTWGASPLKAPVRYKVYRSSGTGFRVVSGLDKVATSPTTVKSISRTTGDAPPTPAGTRSAASYQYMSAKPADARIMSTGKQGNLPVIQNKGVSLEFIKKVDLSAVSLESYQFLGETASPTFQDLLPRSRPMYYNYRVVPINRWGIEGKPAMIQVRVSATVQPPTPELVSTYANSDGGVTLTLKPLDNKEECAKYLAYRKPIDLSAIIKNSLTAAAAVRVPEASAVVSTAAKRAGPLKFNADMKIAPMSAIVSSATASKARDHGMRSQMTMPIANAKFAKNLRQTLAKPNYELVGEIGADAIDKNGYVRYNDMKDLVPNQLYSYTIIAVDADSWKSTASKPSTASPWKVNVSPVTNLNGTSSGNGITLSWTAPVGEILGYVVLKGIAKNMQFVQISDTIKPTTFTDFSVIKGKTYTYRVQAVDSLGNLSEFISVDCMHSK
ncbi:MAG: hypothetical protein ACYC0V_04185 [Armatimonadota bacterium]